LSSGDVTITPETSVSFDEATGLIDFIIDGFESWMLVDIDEDKDAIEMEALNED
jgi:hypothetical protein